MPQAEWEVVRPRLVLVRAVALAPPAAASWPTSVTTRIPPLNPASRRSRHSQAPLRQPTNAIERLHKEFKRRIKTQTVLPLAETVAMLFWALMASSQITMRKVDGWQTLGEKLADPMPVDLAA